MTARGLNGGGARGAGRVLCRCCKAPEAGALAGDHSRLGVRRVHSPRTFTHGLFTYCGGSVYARDTLLGSLNTIGFILQVLLFFYSITGWLSRFCTFFLNEYSSLQCNDFYLLIPLLIDRMTILSAKETFYAKSRDFHLFDQSLRYLLTQKKHLIPVE